MSKSRTTSKNSMFKTLHQSFEGFVGPIQQGLSDGFDRLNSERQRVFDKSKEMVKNFWDSVVGIPVKEYLLPGTLFCATVFTLVSANPDIADAKSHVKPNVKPKIHNAATGKYQKTANTPEKTTLTSAHSKAAVKSEKSKILIIRIGFNNTKEVHSDKEWSEYVFGTEGDTVNSYFNEVSDLRFQLEPVQEKYSISNDGVITVKLNRDYEFGKQSSELYEYNDEIIKEALNEASKYINFSLLDKNKNKFITSKELGILFVFGNVESSSSQCQDFRAYASKIIDYKLQFNGVHFGGYSPEAEKENKFNPDEVIGPGTAHIPESSTGFPTEDGRVPIRKAPVGLIAHEGLHALKDLPDLYDETRRTMGLNNYSIMASGSWGFDWEKREESPGDSPTSPDAFSKYKAGFVDPIEISPHKEKMPQEFTLYSIGSTKGKYNVLKINTPDPNQYFLIENRQFIGPDKSLKYDVAKDSNGGIIVYRVNEQKSNFMTGPDPLDKQVDILEADECIGFSRLDTSQFYDENGPASRPFFTNNFYGDTKYISAYTAPNTNLHSGLKTGIIIEVLDKSSDSMKVRISYEKPAPREIKNMEMKTMVEIHEEEEFKWISFNTIIADQANTNIKVSATVRRTDGSVQDLGSSKFSNPNLFGDFLFYTGIDESKLAEGKNILDIICMGDKGVIVKQLEITVSEGTITSINEIASVK